MPMHQQHNRGLARRLFARAPPDLGLNPNNPGGTGNSGPGAGDNGGAGGSTQSSSAPLPEPPISTPLPSSKPVAQSSSAPQSSSTRIVPNPSPSSSAKPTPSSRPVVVSSSIAPSSSSSASSTGSTSTRSTSSTTTAAAALNTNNTSVQIINGGGAGATSSFRTLSPTNIDSAGSTVTADPVTQADTSKTSAGAVAGGVIGGLLALGVLVFIVITLIRRHKRNRRYARRHESDFGTFNRQAFVKEKEPPVVPDMVESSRPNHNVAPSISGEAALALPGATPPSQALAAANAAAGGAASTGSTAGAAALQERPKYVYGAPVNSTSAAQQEEDANAVADEAGGAYSSQPQMQTAYNAEAYGSYAQYDHTADVGVAVGGVYQDAQREYQGQQGYYDQQQQQQYYDPNQQYYDPNQAYYGHDQYAQQGAYAQYDYSQQHQAYAAGASVVGGVPPETEGVNDQQQTYQPPHPYAHGARVTGNGEAYGGM